MRTRMLCRIMLNTLVFIMVTSLNLFASTLNLKIITNKTTYELNDKVVATVDWGENMQAACFTIKYDNQKLQFDSSNIADTFYNLENDGEISVNWASIEEVDYTQMIFTFNILETGEANIYIKEVDGFANGNLESPDNYNFSTFGSTSVTINNIINKSELDDTLALQIIPNAGIEMKIVLVIMALFIVAIIGFVKHRRLKDIRKF